MTSTSGWSDVGRAERVGHDPHDAVRTERDQRHPDRADDQAAQRVGQELQRRDVDDGAGEATRLEVA